MRIKTTCCSTVCLAMASAFANDVPAFIADKAAFWVDATAGKGLQTETDGTGVSRVTRWCDCREGDPSARIFYSALPVHVETGLPNENVAAPIVTNVIGNASVYFGGVGSGQCLMFKTADDADLMFTTVLHAFVVHGCYQTWGAVLGCSQKYGESGFRANRYENGAFVQVPGSTSSYFDMANRGDQHGYLYTARFAQNGQMIDPVRTPPRLGFEVLSCSMNENCQTFDNFFRQRTDTKTVGGDYLSEVIFFTNRLNATEVAQVEQYLMDKWTLYYDNDMVRELSRGVTQLSVAADETAVVSPGAGETTDPIAFSGSGTVTKSGVGTLVIGPSGDGEPFAGTLSLTAGKVAVRGGAVPAILAAANQTVQAKYAESGDNPDAEAQLKDGTDLTSVADGDAGVFRKVGNAELRVNAVAPDVSWLMVEDGSLVLTAKTQVRDDVAEVPVPIPNAGFEAYFAANPTETSHNLAETEDFGWYGTGGGSVRYFSTRDGGWSTYVPATKLAAEGSTALLLKSTSTDAHTFVDIPQAGTYEFSCASTIRGNAPSGKLYPIGIFFGTTWDAAQQVGTILNGKTVWPRTVCRFAVTAPGRYALGFKAIYSAYTDDAYIVDDLRLRSVRAPSSTAVPVPNGDFERFVAGTPIYPYPSTATQLTGWTLDASQSENLSGEKNSAVGACGLYQYAVSDVKDTFLSECANDTVGCVHLLFVGTGGKATSASFIPGAGSYRLRAKMAYWNMSYYDWTNKKERNGYSGAPKISVGLIRNGVRTELGAVRPIGHRFGSYVWPEAFRVEDGEMISLELSQTAEQAAALLDDLELEPADEADVGELVRNGSFEAPLDADNFQTVDGSSGFIWKNDRQLATAFGSASNFGYNVYDGCYQMQIGCDAGVRQTLSFPSPGLYRLRFAAHSRTGWRSKTGLNPIHAYLTHPDDGSQMVTDIVTVRPYGCNYCEYSALFTVPTAGSYRMYLCGTALDSEHTDRRSYVDGVSVRKVVGETETVPAVPENLRLSVSEGANLQLDFTGTLRVRSLRLNGVSCVGTVNAATHPGHITGAGSLEIPPRGFALIVK